MQSICESGYLLSLLLGTMTARCGLWLCPLLVKMCCRDQGLASVLWLHPDPASQQNLPTDVGVWESSFAGHMSYGQLISPAKVLTQWWCDKIPAAASKRPKSCVVLADKS